MSEPTMIPMARIRSIVERFGDYEAVPWGLFLVMTAEERPITQADIDAGLRIMAELERGDIRDVTIRIPAASSEPS